MQLAQSIETRLLGNRRSQKQRNGAANGEEGAHERPLELRPHSGQSAEGRGRAR